MSVYLNYAAMAAVQLRSNGLGPLDSIAHPLNPGSYIGTVWLNDQKYGTFALDVASEGDGEQIDIDLASVAKPDRSGGRAAFSAGPQKDFPVFAVFHSEGEQSGFRVVLHEKEKRTMAFDSAALTKGDYYILTPLKPGRWNILTSSGAKGVIVVEQAKPAATPRPSQHSATIRTDGKTFKPAEARMVSGDGLVFEVAGDKVAIEVVLDEKKGTSAGKRSVGVRSPGRITLKPKG